MSLTEQDAVKVDQCPPALQEIIEEFQSATPAERLEFLLEYSMDLPDLPPRLLEDRASLEQVHECQTPVFLHTEIDENQVRFFIDAPEESPTVRGYASVLQHGFRDATPEEVLDAPDDIYRLLGLHEAISPLRLRGLHALMGYMQRQVRRML